MNRPGLLWDAVRKLDLKALWLPDRNRILIDSEFPPPKQRWGEAHEIGHSILPWHQPAMHGDAKHTLSPACEHQIENEANYTAGQLLFMQHRFSERLRSSRLSIDRIKSLSKTFRNSLTTSLWRAVEATDGPAFGMVCQHPKTPQTEKPIRYFIGSRVFQDQFRSVTPGFVFDQLTTFCRLGNGPIGKQYLWISDANGDMHEFMVDCFCNSYDTLVLGIHLHTRIPVVSFANASLGES